MYLGLLHKIENVYKHTKVTVAVLTKIFEILKSCPALTLLALSKTKIGQYIHVGQRAAKLQLVKK